MLERPPVQAPVLAWVKAKVLGETVILAVRLPRAKNSRTRLVEEEPIM